MLMSLRGELVDKNGRKKERKKEKIVGTILQNN